jgi:hypothetical protein
VTDIIMAIGGVFAPTVAAITLCLYGREALPARLRRNAAFDRGANVFVAVFIGTVGVEYSQKAPFYLLLDETTVRLSSLIGMAFRLSSNLAVITALK